ncbi:hypothetical protein A7K94_0219605, partial [Modestobacter sp. VKM Ac-2676]
METFLAIYSRPSITWADLAWLRERTRLPIVLKGVLHPDDARRAADQGVDGLVVSTHGGRQVDRSIAALDALPGVVAATAPFSEADAAKRVFDAAKPLRAAGIPVLTALDTVADAMRGLVTAPMVKGEVSGRLAELLPEPYLRWCRPCQATHLYEQPFRLAALPAGLELTPGTSPPVLRPVPGLTP